MEKYVWEGRRAQQALAAITKWSKDNPVNIEEVEPIPDEQLKPAQAEYKKTLEEFMTQGKYILF